MKYNRCDLKNNPDLIKRCSYDSEFIFDAKHITGDLKVRLFFQHVVQVVYFLSNFGFKSLRDLLKGVTSQCHMICHCQDWANN